MKLSKAHYSSFNHNDALYAMWHDSRHEQAEECNENINIDTVIARTIFAISVIDFLNANFKLSLVYDGLYMPKYNNYECDAIKFSYNASDFNLLLDAISDYYLSDELTDNIKHRTTTRDGYMAFYTEDELKSDKELYIKVILETLFNSEDVQAEYIYNNYDDIFEKLEDSVILECK